MKVGTKLNLALYGIVAVMLVMTIMNYVNLGGIKDKQDYAFDHRVERILLAEEMRANLLAQGLYLRAYVLESTDENRTSLYSYAEGLDEGVKAFEETSSKESLDEAETLAKYNKEFNTHLEEAVKAVQTGKVDKALELVNGPLQDANRELLGIASKVLEDQKENLALVKEETGNTVTNSKVLSIIAVVIGSIIGLVSIIFVRKSLVRPLEELKAGATYIAEGDLTQKDILIRSKDEISQLGIIFNEMKTNLHSLIKNVQSNSEQLSASAEELSASVEEVSATAEDAVRQLEKSSDFTKMSAHSSNESADAMEETAHGVNRISEASQTLHSTSMQANEVATHGSQIITQAQKQMQIISDSSSTVDELVKKLADQTDEIKTISKAITDITDQTNLLALNASIEAARAGEHGKGFAVVANEVKKLAEESKASANSIGTLTAEIQKDTHNVSTAMADAMGSVREGVNIITEAGKSFSDITVAVDTMIGQIQEVSATSEELSASAEQVTASVKEIAAGAEQTFEAIDVLTEGTKEQVNTMTEVGKVAVDLADRATDLQNEIQKFRV